MRFRPRSRAAAVATGLAVVLAGVLVGAATAVSVPHAAPKPVVVDSGRAPDGTRYEHILYNDSFDTGPTPAATSMWCHKLRWPQRPARRTGAQCAGPGKPRYETAFAGVSFGFVQAPLSGAPDVVAYGRTSPEVRRVQLFYRHVDGTVEAVPVDFRPFRGGRLARAARRLRAGAARSLRPQPFGVFTAFVGGTAAADEDLAGRADAASADAGAGSAARTGDLNGIGRDGQPCDEWEGPFRLVATNADGSQTAYRPMCPDYVR